MTPLLLALLAWTAGGWAVFLVAEHLEHRLRLDELIAVLAWPVTVPTVRLLRWWQWGTRRHHLHRYADLKWWQRGERERRG